MDRWRSRSYRLLFRFRNYRNCFRLLLPEQECPTLIKETSVVSFVGASDLYVAFNFIGSNSYEFMIPYLVMAIIYIVLVLLISFGIKMMERSLRKSDRSH